MGSFKSLPFFWGGEYHHYHFAAFSPKLASLLPKLLSNLSSSGPPTGLIWLMFENGGNWIVQMRTQKDSLNRCFFFVVVLWICVYEKMLKMCPVDHLDWKEYNCIKSMTGQWFRKTTAPLDFIIGCLSSCMYSSVPLFLTSVCTQLF